MDDMELGPVIEWNGGECPIPADTIIQGIDRDGHVWDLQRASFHPWSHAGTSHDLVAYRVATARREAEARYGYHPNHGMR